MFILEHGYVIYLNVFQPFFQLNSIEIFYCIKHRIHVYIIKIYNKLVEEMELTKNNLHFL